MVPKPFRANFDVFHQPRGGGPLSVSLGCPTKCPPAGLMLHGNQIELKNSFSLHLDRSRGEQKKIFLLNFGSRGAWGPRGAILWGTLRTQKAVTHLGIDENIKVGTEWLGKHRNST